MKVTSALLFGLSTLPLSLCIPITAATSSATCNPTPVVNGDFETGSLSPWVPVTTPYAGDNTSISIISPGYQSKYAGNLFVSVESIYPKDSAAMYQYFGPLCAGQNYTITILYNISKESRGTGHAYLGMLELTSDLAQTLFGQTISLDTATVDSLGNAYGAWHSLSYSFTPNGNLIRVSFSAFAGASSLFSVAFDNVSIQ